MNSTTNRAATRNEIAAEAKKVARYSDTVLFCEHRAACRDAMQIVGQMAPWREARCVALHREMQKRGLVAA
jgi:hypothetical protein